MQDGEKVIESREPSTLYLDDPVRRGPVELWWAVAPIRTLPLGKGPPRGLAMRGRRD